MLVSLQTILRSSRLAALLALLGCGLAALPAAAQNSRFVPFRLQVPAQQPSQHAAGTQTQFQQLHLAPSAGAAAAGVGGAAFGEVASGPTIPVDLDQFADLVQERVDGKCVGWQFAIFKDAKLVVERAGGNARNAADAPARLMSTTDRLEIASCSKTITAIATVKALTEKGISLDASIGPYVPQSWEKHPSIDGVTFKQVLTHKSGFKKTDALDDYEQVPGKANLMVKSLFKVGVIDPAKPYDYENLNYKVLQVLLPYVVNPGAIAPLESDPPAHDVCIGEQYVQIVRQRVFVPAGLGSKVYVSDWHPSGSNYAYARYYDASNPTAAGIENADGLLGSGPGGWTLTARQLSQVIAAWEAGYLVSPGMVAQMKQDGIGMGTSSCKFGSCYRHNGGFGSGGKGGGSRWVAFPGNVQVALIYNSKNNSFDYDNTFELLKDCYEQAAGKPDLVITSFQRTGAASYQNGFWHIPVKMTVQNKGNGVAPGSFVNAVKYGNDWRWTGFMNGLAPGNSATASGTVTIKDSIKKMAGWSITLQALCDAPVAAADTSIPPYGRVSESNESNNQASISLELPGGLGLTGQMPTVPSGPGASVPQRVTGQQPSQPTRVPGRPAGIRLPGRLQLPEGVPATQVEPTPPPTRIPSSLVPASRVPASRVPASRVPATDAPPSRVPTTHVPATRVPATRVSAESSGKPPAREPSAVLGGLMFSPPASHAPLPDLRIRDIRFADSQPKVVYVVVGNAGPVVANANVLRLTVRKINGISVGRTKEVAVPALAPAESKVIAIDAASILPASVDLKSTTFRLDVDITSIVQESDENNNLKWHNL